MWNSKPKKRTCNCRSRSKNNPKYSGGVCYLSGGLRPAVEERLEGKKMMKIYLDALCAGVEPDDVEL